MIFRSFSILAIAAFRFCLTEKLHLPVPTCKRNITNYSSCLRRAIQEAWPLFAKGLPAEFDFPPLDPYFYEYQKGVFDNGDLHGEITAINVTFKGIRTIHFEAVRPYFSNDASHLQINLRTPKIFVTGFVEALGSLAGFQMGGKGYFNITMEDIRHTWDISGPVKDNTWIIEHFRLTPTIRNMKVYLDNFFEGNQEINDVAMMFVNEYWPQLYRMILPIAAENWDTYFSDLITRLFGKLSFSEVFP